MRASGFTGAAFAAIASLTAGMALAQDAQPPVPFEGGTLTITENADFEKVLAFDGRELARNYVVYYNRTVELGGTKVALFDLGDGGNACGTNTLMVWKPEGGDIQTATAGDDCGSPPPAVTDSAIYFVPYLMPGATGDVQVWSPDTGIRLAGTLSFVPQPGTGWADIESKKPDYMLDAFSNAAVYEAAVTLLGDSLNEVATGLAVSGEIQTLPSGEIYGSGCVPHACGGADAFMGLDAKGHKLYFAQQQEGPEPRSWPPVAEWPAGLAGAMKEALAR